MKAREARVLLTGATGGIGQAMARRLAADSLKRHGAPAQLVIADLRADELQTLADEAGWRQASARARAASTRWQVAAQDGRRDSDLERFGRSLQPQRRVAVPGLAQDGRRHGRIAGEGLGNRDQQAVMDRGRLHQVIAQANKILAGADS